MEKIIEHKMNINTIGRDRNVYVYLPYDYYTSNKKYPVVYMQDAQNVLFDEKAMGGVSWGITRNFNNEQQQQCIFVCVDHGREHRIPEYGVIEHSERSLQFIEDGTIPNGIEGEKYIEWFVNSLVPFINENYNTINTLDTTSIVGSSMGGLISLYAICKYPNVFGNAGVLSPAFWFSSDKYYDFVKEAEINGKVYISVGTNESGIERSNAYIDGATKMSNILAYKCDFMYRVVKDGIHHESDWEKLMPEIITYFLNK